MEHKHICRWVSETAAQYPNKIAIEYGPISLTYAQLEEETNRLANFLQASEISPGAIVATLTFNALENVIALIGVLKAGAVIMPLDANMPADRLQSLLAQVPPALLITQPGVIAQQGMNMPLLYLQEQPDHPQALPGYLDFNQTAAVSHESQPDDMAYIFFTSGSTGAAKAIMGRLKGIDHFIRWEIETLGLTTAARVSHLTSPAFDASLRDIFTPLCAGGTLCIPEDKASALDVNQLASWLDQQEITLIHTVPSLLRAVLNSDLSALSFANLQHILLSGETLLPSDVAGWQMYYGDRVQLVNLYGPSETTMTKFAYFVQPEDKNKQTIPIGQPITGTRAILLDDQGNVCSPGELGEIYIRTPYRTLGYYQTPELTAASFVPNPFNNDPLDIVYKTGDLGKLLPDGNFEFIGRRDHQVKVRGVRIELSEIEAILHLHPDVQDGVVTMREDAQQIPYLCAYLVLTNGATSETIKAYLATQLPEYMLPSAFVNLEALPRTITGKVDRQALPEPGQDDAKFVAPRTSVEEALAGIFEDLLGLEQVSIHGDFFELGGHSLLTLQAIARIQQAFDIDLSLEIFFDHSTVAGLAEKVAEQQDELARTAALLEQVKALSEQEVAVMLQ
ncbi:MAG: non-ribosomal peptide synthetase [Chloroflexota bacterium]